MKSKIPTTTAISPAWFLLPIILAISGIAAIRYQSRLISPPASPITTLNQQTKAISQVTSFFYTQVFLDRDKTFVSIPFRFPEESSDQPLWLLLLLDDGDHLLRLIHHPQLANLNWSSVNSNNEVFLYQRQKNYASIDQFLQNPPARNTLLLDAGLKDQPLFANLSGSPLNPQNHEITLDQLTISSPTTNHLGPKMIG
jgi:hypothetical protein